MAGVRTTFELQDRPRLRTRATPRGFAAEHDRAGLAHAVVPHAAESERLGFIRVFLGGAQLEAKQKSGGVFIPPG